MSLAHIIITRVSSVSENDNAVKAPIYLTMQFRKVFFFFSPKVHNNFDPHV